MSQNIEMMLDEDVIYMNHAAIGPMPRSVHAAYRRVYDQSAKLGEASLDLDQMLSTWDAVRHEFAQLIGGQKEGVTLTKNTATGLHIVADGLSHLYAPGKNIVISDIEFTTNSYVWQKVVARYKMELRVIEHNGGPAAWNAIIDDNTVLVAISFVQFSNGYRTDLGMVSSIAHDYGAYVVTDGIQGLGIVPFDVRENHVDFVATGGYKWLMGPMGSGYFYCQPHLLEELDSVLVGWFADRNFHQMSHHEFHPWEDGRQFQTSITVDIYALQQSLTTINQLDPRKSYEHVLRLHNQLVDRIGITEFQITSDLSPHHRSGIITLNHPNAEEMVQQLKQDKIYVAFRDGNIRISPHFHNTENQMDHVIDRLIELL